MSNRRRQVYALAECVGVQLEFTKVARRRYVDFATAIMKLCEETSEAEVAAAHFTSRVSEGAPSQAQAALVLTELADVVNVAALTASFLGIEPADLYKLCAAKIAARDKYPKHLANSMVDALAVAMLRDVPGHPMTTRAR